MWRQQSWRAAAFLTLLVFVVSGAAAQDPTDLDIEHKVRPRRATGILIDRLSQKQREQWRSIERAVFDVDNAGFPLHPKLINLWNLVDSSGHAVYIELPKGRGIVGNTAGSFQLEHFDHEGFRHIAVIRLYLTIIDLADTSLAAAREDGFIPFEKLGKQERYAEVLGHELAHAIHVLSNIDRARGVYELIVQTNEMFYAGFAHRPDMQPGPALRKRIAARDALIDELEAQAESTEEVIWRELIAGKRNRAGRP